MPVFGRSYPLHPLRIAPPIQEVSADVTVTPDAVGVIAGIPSPSISAALTVFPDAVAVTAGIPSPTLSAGSTVSPDAVAVTTGVGDPLVATGSTVTPAAVEVVTTIPSPTIALGAAPAPDAVGVIAGIPTPTVVTGGSVTVVAEAVGVVAGIPTPAMVTSSIITPDAVEVVVGIPEVTITTIVPPLYFTPPHRGVFVPYSIPNTPTDTQPLRSLKPSNPQPVNIFVWDDGTLHEGVPPEPDINVPGWTRRIYAGGHIYGPLTNDEVNELTAAGYGSYLTPDPHPVPQP